jgi:hypothetical protein
MMSAWGNRLLFIYHNNKSDARTTCDTIILGLFDLCHLLPPRPLVPFNSIILISVRKTNFRIKISSLRAWTPIDKCTYHAGFPWISSNINIFKLGRPSSCCLLH